MLLENAMLVAGVKSEAPVDSLDTPVEGCVALFESETETNGSWNTREVFSPTFPFALKFVLVCTRLNAGGTLDLTIPWVAILKLSGFSSGENADIFVAGVPRWESTSSEELGLAEMPLPSCVPAITAS